MSDKLTAVHIHVGPGLFIETREELVNDAEGSGLRTIKIDIYRVPMLPSSNGHSNSGG